MPYYIKDKRRDISDTCYSEPFDTEAQARNHAENLLQKYADYYTLDRRSIATYTVDYTAKAASSNGTYTSGTLSIERRDQ